MVLGNDLQDTPIDSLTLSPEQFEKAYHKSSELEKSLGLCETSDSFSHTSEEEGLVKSNTQEFSDQHFLSLQHKKLGVEIEVTPTPETFQEPEDDNEKFISEIAGA